MSEIIDNPQARRWVNERVRPIADDCQRTFRGLMHLLEEADAVAVDSFIPNTEAVIVDGSEEDGRVPLTGADVHVILAFLRGLRDGLATQEAQAGGTGAPRPLATINKAAVNGAPRF